MLVHWSWRRCSVSQSTTAPNISLVWVVGVSPLSPNGIAGSRCRITRLGQFLGGAFFWIGRIDVPFLSDDIKLVGVALDMVPTYFVKDILVHEAHRHPYMERLALLYMMKAHHRDAFVTRVGAAWRQLIVLAFAPWVARYRVFGSERREQAMQALKKRNKIKDDPNEDANASEEL